MRPLDFLQFVIALILWGAFFRFVFSDFSNNPMSTESNKNPKASNLRIIVGIVTIVVPISAFAYCLYSNTKLSPGLNINPLDDFNKTALQINLDTANSLATLTVGLAGGLWGLILTSERLVRIGHRDVMPFVGGSLSLLFSYVCYRMGFAQYVRMLFEARTVDVSAGFARHWPTWQVLFFGFGFLVSVVALYELYGRSERHA